MCRAGGRYTYRNIFFKGFLVGLGADLRLHPAQTNASPFNMFLVRGRVNWHLASLEKPHTINMIVSRVHLRLGEALSSLEEELYASRHPNPDLAKTEIGNVA